MWPLAWSGWCYLKVVGAEIRFPINNQCEDASGKCEGDDGSARRACSLLQLFHKCSFEIVWIGNHFAGGDLFRCSPVEAKFADAEAFLGAYRRTKDAAGHGTKLIEIARSCRRVEHRASFVVGKNFEPFLCLGFLAQEAGADVARELRRQSG